LISVLTNYLSMSNAFVTVFSIIIIIQLFNDVLVNVELNIN